MMQAAFTVLALSLIALSGQIQGSERADGDPVRLAVYFESLCPDSIRFMTEQLYPTWNNIPDIMDVDLTAYGKSINYANDEGGYDFVCQHGPQECVGNLMLACAKKYITDVSQYVDFTLCVMMSDDPPSSGQACAASLSIDYTDIDPCSTSVEAQQLLHDLGLKQAALDPTLNYVPWMVVNDVHTDEIQASAEFELQDEICSVYEGTAPAACA